MGRLAASHPLPAQATATDEATTLGETDADSPCNGEESALRSQVLFFFLHICNCHERHELRSTSLDRINCTASIEIHASLPEQVPLAPWKAPYSS